MAIKQKGVTTFLLFLVLAVVAVEAQLRDDEPTAAVGHAGKLRAKAAAAAAAPTHLHFYFHDTVSGKSPTAVRVVSPPASSPSPLFGMVNVMDDPLTEGPDQGSAAVIGRAQGLYMGSDQAKLGFLQAMNLVFTAGDYNGSTLALLGRNCPLDAVRELPVVGGTGAFRFARGYALLRTHWLDFSTGDATVEYDVYVMH
ncbi:dirigent protein 22-like [Miscanthus floridulus]|uniref:dirigent protein 22-like n=1 Tax=Miscanthus floridulus TaxID=154761 RepID=UPI0034590060